MNEIPETREELKEVWISIIMEKIENKTIKEKCDLIGYWAYHSSIIIDQNFGLPGIYNTQELMIEDLLEKSDISIKTYNENL